jgi:hypothetical protein
LVERHTDFNARLYVTILIQVLIKQKCEENDKEDLVCRPVFEHISERV